MSLEEFKRGQFSLTDQEKEEAQKEGHLAEKQKKMDQANARLNFEKSNQALKETEREVKRLSEMPESDYQTQRKKLLDELGAVDSSDREND